MKNIIKISSAFLIAVMLTGCSGFLDEKLGTSYDKSSMISTPDALESAVLGIHHQMAASGFKDNPFCEFLATGSGLAIWGNTGAIDNPQQRWTSLLKFTRFANHPEGYGSFRNFYRTIYLCNHFLDIVKDSPVDAAYIEKIVGEVYFVRAMAYFYLVRIWGDVSLHLEAPVGISSEELYKPRENFWTVYCQIVEDLNVAERTMRTFDEMIAVSGNSSGRVCNYAATACRSLVYLTIGTLLEHPDDNFWVNRTPDFSKIGINGPDDAFRLALADAQNVIENGPFELEEIYGDLFRWTEPDDWRSKERIWAMPRSPESNGAGSGLSMWALPNYYEGRENSGNCGRCRPCRWFFQKWCETYGGIKGTDVGYNDNIYVDCLDPRLKVNIIYNDYNGKEGTVAQCYPSKWRVKMTADYSLKTGGIPFYKKYYDPTFNNSVGNADLYVMRLAEVYMIAAEATAWLHGLSANQHGKTAVDYVNVILARARKYRDDAGNIRESSEPADWKTEDFKGDVTALLDAIFWERCFEMPFEHHEYFDTHRMGANWIVRMIAKPKNEFLKLPEQTEGSSPYTGKFFGENFQYDEDWQLVRKGLINAYPFDELTYNPFLDINRHDPLTGQNPVEVFWQ
ncbi:MAG: RagB/SusD family nutrient uptake outer membrane protein [Bacteroidales bacterium]|nr:RagB/SusD family nutrient uptake outer membrane protein [Bacteroidales bacterium]